MKTRSIVIVFMIVGIMTALAQADDKQKDRIREQKKIYKQIQEQLREQKQDQLREQKQDGSCQDEGVLKANDDVDPVQDQTRVREQKKTQDQLGDQLRDQKRDQLREQKQDGSCQDEGVLKANDDVDPVKDRTRTREQKKDGTVEQNRHKIRNQIWRRIKNYLL